MIGKYRKMRTAPMTSPLLTVKEESPCLYHEREKAMKIANAGISYLKGCYFTGALEDFVHGIIKDLNQCAKNFSLSMYEKASFFSKELEERDFFFDNVNLIMNYKDMASIMEAMEDEYD